MESSMKYFSGAVDVEVKVTLDLARVCFNTVRKKWYLSVTSESVEKIITQILLVVISRCLKGILKDCCVNVFTS